MKVNVMDSSQRVSRSFGKPRFSQESLVSRYSAENRSSTSQDEDSRELRSRDRNISEIILQRDEAFKVGLNKNGLVLVLSK